VRDFARAARAVLPRMVRDYYRSGADGEATLRANRRAFRRCTLLPRVLVDVSRVTLETELLGELLPHPILVAPTAYQKLAHPEGEVAMARGAEAAGALLCVSTLATTSLEDVAAASAAPKWFQLYTHRDRGLTRALVERAHAAGYRALVLTVDTPLLGRRLADVRNRFALPEGLTMENLRGASGAAQAEVGSALAKHVAARHDPSTSWRDLEWLASLTPLPVVLKGILRPDDATRAAAAGVAGVIVSNHGGRQLDGSVATLDALPAVVDAVAGRCPVLVDGGVRWGSDALKALALGARAVLVGRPALWGLAVAGADGVARVLAALREELTLAMTLAGCPDLAAVTPDLVSPARLDTRRAGE
jgi:isopentenyl diphosphate isomerase/L-lactate dehydrogenase-like FMN-dependent dehydrogenase